MLVFNPVCLCLESDIGSSLFFTGKYFNHSFDSIIHGISEMDNINFC
jgi:hypothetical protein